MERKRRTWLALAASVMLTGCAAAGSSGPSARRVVSAGTQQIEASGIKVVDVTDAIARRISDAQRPVLLSQLFGAGAPEATVIGPGDVIDVAIVEAPPAVLFSSSFSNSQVANAGPVRENSVSSGLNLPQQMVDLNGRITVPFAGAIQAAGRTPEEIAREIVARLHGKAHDPQVVVRRVTNASSTVTVLGDVGQSGRFPITAKGERVLDVIAAAGGAKQALAKSVVQVTRGDRTATQPLSALVADGHENIRLQPNDVVTVYFQPYTFTVLGAAGTNAEVPLEATSVSLSQALGRVGGLLDNRADIHGVFIFRFEDPAALPPAVTAGAKTTSDGKIPVIYRVDLKNASAFLIAQNFPIKNKDVLYVANAPLADLIKFANIVSSITYSVVNIGAGIVR